jgi:hypothetical protein
VKRLTRIEWHKSDGTVKEIFADEPDVWISSLKRTNEYFIVYPGKGPIPSLKSEKVAV